MHDGITPPSASRRLHRALGGSTLVWFPTGHWPNLASQAAAIFHAAAAEALLGNGVGANLLRESAALEAEITQWDAPPPPEETSCLPGDCAIL